MKITLQKYLLVFFIALSNCICESAEAKNKLTIGTWIPYWRKSEGCKLVQEKLNYFNEISPFAFEVQEDGTLRDTLRIDELPWPGLLEKCRNRKIAVVPAILWTNSQAMHITLSDPTKRHYHIQQIIDLVEKRKFDGVDIDYEGKNIIDRVSFSAFITELSLALRAKRRLLYCTIEPRTTDTPPPDWQGSRAMAWANDFSILNKYCDKVRIMAYDQFIQTKGGKKWKETIERPYIANSDILWVEQVLKYTLQTIAPGKIMLGIPTYSWEFVLSGHTGNWQYECLKSISYPQALELAHSQKITPMRNDGGELFFTYQDQGLKHLVSLSDSESIRQKIQLAQKYDLHGIVFFKMDGLADDNIWMVLEHALDRQ